MVPGTEYVGVEMPNDASCFAVSPANHSWASFFKREDLSDVRSMGSVPAPAALKLIRQFTVNVDEVTTTVTQGLVSEPTIFNKPIAMWSIIEYIFIVVVLIFMPATIWRDIATRDNLGASDWLMVGFFVVASSLATVFAKEKETLNWVLGLSTLAVAWLSLSYMDKSLVPLGGYFLAHGVLALVPSFSIFQRVFGVTGYQNLFNTVYIPSELFLIAILVFGIDSKFVRKDNDPIVLGVATFVSILAFRYLIMENIPQVQGTMWKTIFSFLGTVLVVFIVSVGIATRRATAGADVQETNLVSKVTQFFQRSQSFPAYMLTACAGLLLVLSWFPPQ